MEAPAGEASATAGAAEVAMAVAGARARSAILSAASSSAGRGGVSDNVGAGTVLVGSSDDLPDGAAPALVSSLAFIGLVSAVM